MIWRWNRNTAQLRLPQTHATPPTSNPAAKFELTECVHAIHGGAGSFGSRGRVGIRSTWKDGCRPFHPLDRNELEHCGHRFRLVRRPALLKPKPKPPFDQLLGKEDRGGRFLNASEFPSRNTANDDRQIVQAKVSSDGSPLPCLTIATYMLMC